jgi:hypothetical protein
MVSSPSGEYIRLGDFKLSTASDFTLLQQQQNSIMSVTAVLPRKTEPVTDLQMDSQFSKKSNTKPSPRFLSSPNHEAPQVPEPEPQAI